MNTTSLSNRVFGDGSNNRLVLLDRALVALVVGMAAFVTVSVVSHGIDNQVFEIALRTLSVCLVVGLIATPLGLILTQVPKTRRPAAVALVAASTILAFGVWMASVIAAWDYVGKVGTTIGLAAGGVGVIAVASGSALWSGDYLPGTALILATALVVFLRRFAFYAVR